MQRFNIFNAEMTHDEGDPDGYHTGYNRFGPAIGAAKLGATIYELGVGQSICPYHYEYPHEEWAIVLTGRPTLRHPGGEDVLEPGDTVCFPVGPEGAHQFFNRTDEPTRVMLLSTKGDPSIAIYPDSKKIGAWTGAEGDKIIARLGNDLDYWDGEIETGTTTASSSEG